MLREVSATLAALPPLVVATEVDQLRERLAAVARGEAFLLQGGDCAETFHTSSQADIAGKVRVLLQMAVVLTYGASLPVVKLGRIAGQYAKPRSSDLDATGQLSYRGDMVNDLDRRPHARPAPHPAGLQHRRQHAEPAARVRRAAGWPRSNRVHSWNTEFARSTDTGSRYEQLAGEIDRAVQFMRACGVRDAALDSVELYAGHEALILDYERALTRIEDGRAYDLSGPLRLGRRAQPPARRRAHRLRLAHRQPDRGQARPVHQSRNGPPSWSSGSTRTARPGG